ncbi:MAG: hypothetical protein JOZ69_14610, partial [Myxococcales bacterium]|nr:hypothetical protein [Myxococcales bacterium]
QAEREDFARARAAAVARELAFVLLELPHDVATAAVDGTALAREVWSTPIPLDPGEHTVLLTAPGKKPRSATVTMSGAPGVRVFAIAPLEHEAHPPPPPAGGAPAALRDGAAPGRVPGYIAAGLAAAGLGLGAGFGIDAMSKRGAAESHCPGRFCDAQGSTLLSQARSSATVSTVAFGAGGASALVALWFLLRPAPSGETRSAWVTPVLEAHAAGMGVRGTW